jgi:hypothetical protein
VNTKDLSYGPFAYAELFHFQVSASTEECLICQPPYSAQQLSLALGESRFDELPPIALGPTRNLA